MRRLILILLIFSSCVDQKDYDINSASINPAVAFPLVSGNLSIQDILHNKDSAYIKIDADDLVYVEYSNTLISTDIRNLFKIPDNTINQSFVLPSGIIPPHTKDIRLDSTTEAIDFGLSPEHLSGIDFKSGTISYASQLLPSSGLQYQVLLTSPDLISKSTHLSLSIVAGTGSLQLSDYTATLNSNKFNLKMVVVLKASGSPAAIGLNSSVAVHFALTGMDFNSITGFFGDQSVSPASSTLNIGAFGNSLSSANASFAQPVVTLKIENDYGVPCQVSFLTFEARKEGASLAAVLTPASPISVSSPAVIGNSATTPIVVSNTKQMIDFGPTSFYYNISARMNKGLVSGNNFLADTSKLRVSLNVQIPLFGHATRISISDTAKVDLGKLSQSQVTQASLKVAISNELPLDAKVQFYMTDDKYNIIDSLLTTVQSSLAKGSTVTATGDLQAAGEMDQLMPLSSDALSQLFTAKYIIIKAVMSTPLDGAGNPIDVKFKSKYVMKVNLGLLADLKFNVTF